MCGRFAQLSPAQRYADMFGISTSLDTKPRFNVAPSTDILACRLSSEGDKELIPLHWGLVPSWSKGLDKRFSMINARAETINEKPAYRGPFRHHRCIIPVDGFYEWHEENGKQPYYIHKKNEEPFALAGIWDHWDDKEGDKILSCSIIVCEANDFMQPIHERMPVMLSSDVYDNWLENDDTDYLQELLVPYEKTDIIMDKVARTVNNPRNDFPGLITPI